MALTDQETDDLLTWHLSRESPEEEREASIRFRFLDMANRLAVVAEDKIEASEEKTA